MFDVLFRWPFDEKRTCMISSFDTPAEDFTRLKASISLVFSLFSKKNSDMVVIKSTNSIPYLVDPLASRRTTIIVVVCHVEVQIGTNCQPAKPQSVEIDQPSDEQRQKHTTQNTKKNAEITSKNHCSSCYSKF